MRASILGKVLSAAAVASVLLVTLGVGVAWALTIDCTINPVALCEGSNARDEFAGEDVDDGVGGRRDVIEGERSSDTAHGNGGNDRILGGKGADGELGGELSGGAGNDYVDGGPGDDDNVKGVAATTPSTADRETTATDRPSTETSKVAPATTRCAAAPVTT